MISGRRYLSSLRAAKEHGYHSDYIGQLIRANKVKGQKVGRAWYVDAESLATYFGKGDSSHQNKTEVLPPEKEEVPPKILEEKSAVVEEKIIPEAETSKEETVEEVVMETSRDAEIKKNNRRGERSGRTSHPNSKSQ